MKIEKRRSSWNFGIAVGMIGAACCLVATADADLGGTVTYTEPAGSLVMPFDVTSGKTSFQLVTRGGAPEISGSIATHWVYWAADCKHLADLLICLTPRDTVVVDPTALQSQSQKPGTNVGFGPIVNLSGSRGLLTVTAYEADGAASGGCRVASPPVQLNHAIVGSWTIANTKTNTGYGADAIGFPTTGIMPDPVILSTGGVRVPTLNPESLTDSRVMVLPVKFPGGNAEFATTEIGPLSKIECDNAFVDNLENSTSLPSIKYKCVGFNPISSATEVEGGDPAIIPSTFALNSSGFLQMSNCRTSSGLLGKNKFVFAFHAEGVGPYGTVASGKYTNLLPD